VTDCPRCGAAVVSGQEYCLECGVRLPGAGLGGRGGATGRAWLLRAFVASVVALVGAAAAVAATERSSGGDEVVTATGGFATVPSSSTLASPPQGRAPGIVEWPAGDDGWTIALASLPQTQGRKPALARARQARRKRLSPVGILDSSSYASLHPGYWIVFTGIYASEAEATSALQPAKSFARTATVRRVVP